MSRSWREKLANWLREWLNCSPWWQTGNEGLQPDDSSVSSKPLIKRPSLHSAEAPQHIEIAKPASERSTTSKIYQYEPLKSDQLEIRMLVLQPWKVDPTEPLSGTLVIVKPPKAPRPLYETISYC